MRRFRRTNRLRDACSTLEVASGRFQQQVEYDQRHGQEFQERRFHEHPTRSNEDDQDAADRRTTIRANPPDDGMASIGNQLDAAHSCAEQSGLPVVGEYSDLHGDRAQFLRMMVSAVAAEPHSGRR